MYLKNHTSFLTQASKKLHFAPEAVLGRELKSIKNNQIVTADIPAERADMIIDMTDIPFPDNQFDSIIVNHVLEHIPDDKKALSELGRILKKNSGRAILQVPISLNSETTFEDLSIDTDAGRLEAFGQEDHLRIYGQDYSAKLKEAGFEVEVFD
jgi:SAM-dependent methyltransferase